MGAITDLSTLLKQQTTTSTPTYETIGCGYIARNSTGVISLGVVKYPYSLWLWDKTRNGTGELTLTTTASIPTRTSYGALAQKNASSGKELWLYRVCGVTPTMGDFTVYDRLYHVGGFSGTVTTEQAPATGATITRNTSGVGNELFIEIHTQIGASTQVGTVSYKNESGTTKTSKTFNIGGSNLREAGRIIPIPLADGDLGVTDFNSITLGGSTGTAGSFGVFIGKRMTYTGMLQYSLDAQMVTGAFPLVKVEDNAALFPVITPFVSLSTGAAIQTTYCFVEN